MRYPFFAAVLLLFACSVNADDAKSMGVAPDEAKEGFVSLFDGKTFEGWTGAVRRDGGYLIEDGVMVCNGTPWNTNPPPLAPRFRGGVEEAATVCNGGGDIYTVKEYTNFILRFEFKLPPGGDNGVVIRYLPLGGHDNGNPAYLGMEIQILDDSHPQYKDFPPYLANGSIYGVVPAAKRGVLKPTGQWNKEEILADGSHIKVTINGTVVVDADLSKIDQTMDGLDHPGLHNVKGRVGFCGYGSPVAFRNLRIKELP